MLEGWKNLTTENIIYAALMAFVITQLIHNVSKFTMLRKRETERLGTHREMDRRTLLNRCMDMFPVETIYFRGKVFTKGMKVRITTFQKRIIEGELIGKNEMDILCVMTGQHIIAHEIAKIEDMIEVNPM